MVFKKGNLFAEQNTLWYTVKSVCQSNPMNDKMAHHTMAPFCCNCAPGNSRRLDFDVDFATIQAMATYFKLYTTRTLQDKSCFFYYWQSFYSVDCFCKHFNCVRAQQKLLCSHSCPDVEVNKLKDQQLFAPYKFFTGGCNEKTPTLV